MPGSSRTTIAGWLGDSLKVRVSAPAEHGKANAAVLEVLAGALGITARQLRIIAGASAARKIVEVTGLAEADVFQRLGSKPQSG